MASYYDSDLDGRVTAYGDVYEKEELTAASNTHPYGTYLRVTRLDTRESVIVKVIDKGPYVEGRIIDLSYAAARELNMLDEGVVEVKVEVHKRSSEQPPNTLSGRQAGDTANTQLVRQYLGGEPTEATTATRAPGPVNTSPGRPAQTTQQSDSKYGLYRIKIEQTPPTGFGVQVSVITDYAMVIKRIADLQAQHFDDGILLSVEPGSDKPLYKLIWGLSTAGKLLKTTRPTCDRNTISRVSWSTSAIKTTVPPAKGVDQPSYCSSSSWAASQLSMAFSNSRFHWAYFSISLLASECS